MVHSQTTYPERAKDFATEHRLGRQVFSQSLPVERGGVLLSSNKTLRMKKLLGFVLGAFLFVPSFASASTLTPTQVSAIITLLEVFGVSQSTIDMVQADLQPAAPDVAQNEPVDVISSGVSAPSPQECLPNPSLTLTPVNVGGPYPVRQAQSFEAQYSTGCTLDPSLSVSYSVTYGNETDGPWATTIGALETGNNQNLGIDPPVQNDDTLLDYSPDDQMYSSGSTPIPVTFTVTVGTTTETVTDN